MKRGIDVSTYQGVVDWAKVKADGIDFAIIKATQGRSETGTYRNFTDSQFVRNIVGAHQAGVRCGVYHYLTAQTVSEAMEEAELFLSAVAPYRNIIDLWSVVDVESKHLPVNKTLLTQIVNTFCSRMVSAGYRPMVYTNTDFLKNRLNDISYWDLWLALWRNKANVPALSDYPNMKVWQWGAEIVDGVTGKVDANYMIADIEVEEPPKSETKPPKSETKPPKSETKPPKSETVAKPGKDNNPAAWALDAVEWCVDNKILLGDQNGDLMLHQPMTREQACLVLERLYKKAVEDAADAVARRLMGALKEV